MGSLRQNKPKESEQEQLVEIDALTFIKGVSGSPWLSEACCRKLSVFGMDQVQPGVIECGDTHLHLRWQKKAGGLHRLTTR